MHYKVYYMLIWTRSHLKSVSYILANITLVHLYFSVSRIHIKSKMYLTQNEHHLNPEWTPSKYILNKSETKPQMKTEVTLDKWQETLE